MQHKKISYAKYGYIFCIPFVLAFLLFSLYPIIYTTIIGFTDLKGLGKLDFKILDNPFGNFELILKNPSFKKSIYNTVLIWLVNFFPQIFMATLFTAWFTSHRNKIKGQGFFKVIFYMPNIITAASIAMLFNALFAYPIGPVNDLMIRLGVIDQPFNHMLSKTSARGVIAFIQFWQWYGYTMIVLISGVLGLNPELFEAAEIDGANGIKSFFLITLPNLRSIIVFTLITSLIGGLQMFDIPRLYNLGNPDSSTLTTSVFIYNQAFAGSYMYNRAAAASMIMFAIIAVLSIFVFYNLRDKYEAKQRKENKRIMKELKKKAAGGTV